MFRRTFIFLCALWVQAALASPFVVSDPSPNPAVTHCGIYLNSGKRVLSEVDLTGACRYDVSSVPEGANVVSASFVIVDEVWGTQEGPLSDPLSFTRPSFALGSPGSLSLEP
jgi:hypothetical protein